MYEIIENTSFSANLTIFPSGKTGLAILMSCQF